LIIKKIRKGVIITSPNIYSKLTEKLFSGLDIGLKSE